MQFWKNAAWVAGVLVSTATCAAPVVSWTTDVSGVYAVTNGFESTGTLATNTTLTSQFAASGIVFSGAARANGCGTTANAGWASYGLAGNNYVNTFGPGCTTNATIDTFSMSFDGDVSRLALDIYNSNYSGDDTLQLLNDGLLVGSYNLASLAYSGLGMNAATNVGNRFFQNSSNTRVGVLQIEGNGSSFDQFRLVESASGAQYGNYTFFDNVRYDANTVPEPTSLALVALALTAGGAVRARRRSA